MAESPRWPIALVVIWLAAVWAGVHFVELRLEADTARQEACLNACSCSRYDWTHEQTVACINLCKEKTK